jgi:hypothetical protein
VFTGIHPPGSLGVVELMCAQIAELYEQAGTGNFSVLVQTEFDPESHEPRRVGMITPIYHLTGSD